MSLMNHFISSHSAEFLGNDVNLFILSTTDTSSCEVSPNESGLEEKKSYKIRNFLSAANFAVFFPLDGPLRTNVFILFLCLIHSARVFISQQTTWIPRRHLFKIIITKRDYLWWFLFHLNSPFEKESCENFHHRPHTSRRRKVSSRTLMSSRMRWK